MIAIQNPILPPLHGVLGGFLDVGELINNGLPVLVAGAGLLGAVGVVALGGLLHGMLRREDAAYVCVRMERLGEE